jgi:regulatory protein
VAAVPSGGRRRNDPRAREELRERRAAVDDVATVLAAAARLLEARPRTVADVRGRLVKAGYRSDLADAAVARLLELGYLDDEEFARAWVASRDRAHPRGERALRLELSRAGVARETVDAVLEERVVAALGVDGADGEPRDDGSPDEDAALRLLASRRAALERVDGPRRRRERAYGLLARAGFDPDTAGRAVERFLRPPG